MDFVAGIIELFGLWNIGSKKRWSFLVFMLCNVLWIMHVLHTGHTYGLLFICVPAFCMNVRNYIKWGKCNHEGRKNNVCACGK